MSLSQLDPTSALIVVDLQRGILALPGAHPIVEVIANSARLADAFRERGLPVALVNVAGRAPGRTERARAQAASGAPRPVLSAEALELLPELGSAPDDILVTKRTWGAFTGTELDAALRARGVTQVVLTGIATSAGVESTARQAHELGYHVTLVTDAMTDASAEAHDGSVARVFPAIGETGTTDEVLDLLADRA
ncbi:isochorismatase family protein [Pseudolysinimonas sp.]|uniref:isochorismatase family protein n=1 Tax=Pseudolysinimonas sp. TaxID=2680009 RepID=UPI003F801D5F